MARPKPLNARFAPAFPAVALLFFVWGYISANNDPLLMALKQLHSLTYVEAQLTHFTFAIAFGLVSLPAAMLCARIGFARTIPTALAVMVAGCVWVAVVAGHQPYPALLAGLFLLACGIVALQVAANPLAAQLGDPAFSHWRLNVAQSLNSLGVVIGANAGAAAMLSAADEGATDAAAIRIAYLGMATLTVAAGCLAWLSLRTIAAEPRGRSDRPAFASAFRSRWAWFGAATLGLYVGAEVALSSLMVPFLNQPAVIGAGFDRAGHLLANFYWGGALAGRIAGIFLLGRMRAAVLLGACAAGAVTLCLVAVVASGWVAALAALGVGLMNSIMFPTIFSITLERARVPAAATSGLLCVAIVGGALLPLASARLADVASLAAAFALPLAAYAFILLFALAGNERSPIRRA